MYKIESKNILTPQNGLNIYRGRTEDSILLTEIPGGDSMDIGVKMDAPDQLDSVLRSRRSKSIILMGNLGDPYNRFEEEYRLTRKCLKIIENNDYGVVIATKQSLILRDIDILQGIAKKTKCAVELTIPTLDEKKLKKLEGEEVISVSERLELITTLREAGIAVLVDLAPVIPFINDDEVLDILQVLAEYDILGVDLADLRLAIKKSVRDFFYMEYSNRFPKEYKEFAKENAGKPGELIPRDYKKKLKESLEFCEEHGILSSGSRIKSWKRQYENKTEGEQLSFNFT
ncbi:DNA repair photolyase [Lachnospiraceae bacterium NE2001]|nr:DNA repair photolyase [Lachnospiraceae bacterium NE2001]